MSAILASLILILIAVLHLAWAFGATWPETSEQNLVRRVAGFDGLDRMPPPAASAAVAAILLLGAHITLAVAGLSVSLAPVWLYHIAIWVMAAVFLVRGLAAYTRPWRALTPVEPFAQMDRRYYGPLCLLLAVLVALAAIS